MLRLKHPICATLSQNIQGIMRPTCLRASRRALSSALSPGAAYGSLKYHVPYKLSLLQRAVLLPLCCASAVLDPSRADMVAAVGDMTSSRYLQTLRKRLQMTEQGRLLLEEKPLISEESLNAKKLRLYDSNTFGKHYIDFMDVHHISADSRAAVKFESDSELAYILMRCRQIHDFWHVLLGLPPSVLGEVALKRFEAKVVGLPVAVMGGLFGQLALTSSERSKLYKDLFPAIDALNISPGELLAYPYEKHLGADIHGVRRTLNINKIPTVFN